MMMIWNKVHIKVIRQKVSQGQTRPAVSFTICTQIIDKKDTENDTHKH